MTKLKTSVYDNSIDQDEEPMSHDLVERDYLNKNLKRENNFGKLKANEKETIRKSKKSKSLEIAQSNHLEIMHDDFYFTENKTDLFRKNFSAYPSLNCLTENFNEDQGFSKRKSSLNNYSPSAKMDSNEELDLEQRIYLNVQLKEEIKAGKLNQKEKKDLLNRNKTMSQKLHYDAEDAFQ